VESDSSKWLRIRRLVAQNVCHMDRQAKANLERIVYNLAPRKETHTAPGPTESRNDCQPRNAIILTLQTICLERSGDALERRVDDE
jgi:hypothetical protein